MARLTLIISLTDTIAKPSEKGLGCLSNTGCCRAAARISKERIFAKVEIYFVCDFLEIGARLN